MYMASQTHSVRLCCTSVQEQCSLDGVTHICCKSVLQFGERAAPMPNQPLSDVARVYFVSKQHSLHSTNRATRFGCRLVTSNTCYRTSYAQSCVIMCEFKSGWHYRCTYYCRTAANVQVIDMWHAQVMLHTVQYNLLGKPFHIASSFHVLPQVQAAA